MHLKLVWSQPAKPLRDPDQVPALLPGFSGLSPIGEPAKPVDRPEVLGDFRGGLVRDSSSTPPGSVRRVCQILGRATRTPGEPLRGRAPGASRPSARRRVL